MSIERVREYFKTLGIADRIKEIDESSATVALAAKALGCVEGRIAKTISFSLDGAPILIVAAGDMKIDNAKYKARFGKKAKMLSREEAAELIGHAVGGVCPFAVNEGVKIYLDESLKRFQTVFPACGSSNSTAGSAASAPASGVESSAASSEAAGETGDMLPIAAGDLNEIKTGSYKFAASITKVADGQATLSVYGYDSYLPEDIDALQEGSVLRIHDQGDTTVTKLTVTSIDRDADNGYVTINGGIEAGGVELTLDHDVYRTVTFDDYPVYYEMGEVTLPLAGGVTLSDSSADPQASAVETDGADAVAEAVNAEPDGWMPNNTLVFTEDGTISSIVRIWVP